MAIFARSAVREIFPLVGLKGCHFHFGQRLWSRVVDNGFKSDYNNKKFTDFASFIRACIGLSFVPLDRLETEAISILRKMAKQLNLNFLGYNNRLGNSQGLGSHPNPYLLASVLKYELKVGIDNSLAARAQ